MERRIVSFSQDQEGHWVAHLDCGHRQHMRHQPPWQNRAWVTTPEGRGAKIGAGVACRACEDAKGPPDRGLLD